jgi:hypothetical protein
MVSNLAELLGYALIVAFLYILWPPLALLSGGLLLVLWANVRTGKGRAAKASYTEQKTLRRIS